MKENSQGRRRHFHSFGALIVLFVVFFSMEMKIEGESISGAHTKIRCSRTVSNFLN